MADVWHSMWAGKGKPCSRQYDSSMLAVRISSRLVFPQVPHQHVLLPRRQHVEEVAQLAGITGAAVGLSCCACVVKQPLKSGRGTQTIRDRAPERRGNAGFGVDANVSSEGEAFYNVVEQAGVTGSTGCRTKEAVPVHGHARRYAARFDTVAIDGRAEASYRRAPRWHSCTCIHSRGYKAEKY